MINGDRINRPLIRSYEDIVEYRKGLTRCPVLQGINQKRGNVPWCLVDCSEEGITRLLTTRSRKRRWIPGSDRGLEWRTRTLSSILAFQPWTRSFPLVICYAATTYADLSQTEQINLLYFVIKVSAFNTICTFFVTLSGFNPWRVFTCARQNQCQRLSN